MTWGLYFLATHPDVQLKLFNEIKCVVGCNEAGEQLKVTPANMDKLVYMHQVLDETLRCSALATFAARYQDDDSELGGHRIPAGLPWKQLSVLELQQLVSEVAYGCALVQSPWQQLSVLELQQLGSELGGIGLCSCAASVITLVTVAAAKSESWNTYMVNDHRPAFLKPLTAF
ncbi:hypothetical protein LSAT2_011672 [Lamellibrachia satsuma]|nr:hypothetical protein LSAT2_011672 [Lamellibrachia satsuma]